MRRQRQRQLEEETQGFSIQLPISLYDELDRKSREEKMSKAYIVTSALEEYLQKFSQTAEKL